MSDINSKNYWDERFGTGDWEEHLGREQSEFFYKLAIENLPTWLKSDISGNKLSLCDIGCAEGEGVNLFGQEFPKCEVSGTDISEAALERARKYYPTHEFFQGDIFNFEREFDVLFSSNTLEHFENPKQIIDGLLKHANKYFVMLVPFQEYERIDEHFFTFDYSFFPMRKDGFSLVYSKEIDCTEMENTQWPGYEIIAVYCRMKAESSDKTLADFDHSIWEKYLKLKKDIKEAEEEIVDEKHQNEVLGEQIEADRNAIMQIQFEAAQHKQEELDTHETYVWRTGLKMEKMLNKTGISFIRSLLEISDYKRFGLWITLKKGINEGFHRTNIDKHKKQKLKLCADKFLRYKNRRDSVVYNDLTKIDCPCEKGLVSIVLPVLNGEKMLKFAVESVLAQTYKKFELIIVDDGSTDKTGKIADEYAQKDKRIKVIHQENKRLPMSLSTGFEQSRGEFLTWISADNIMLPDCIKIMAEELMQKKNVGMVFGNIRLIDEKGRIKRGHFWYEKPFFSGNVIFGSDANALNTYANNTIGAAFMYRCCVGQILEGYSQYKNTLEDYDYWMRVNSLFNIEHIDEEKPIYLYRMHKNSLTAHDKELGITKNRYKLMVLDDFRRDFYMSSLIWVVETDNEYNENYKQFLKAAENAGQMILSREEALSIKLPMIASGLVYVYFGENAMLEKIAPMQMYSGTVIVTDNENFDGDTMFDLCITTNKNKELKKLDLYNGWFYAEDGYSTFALADSKIKNRLLYQLEGMIESRPHYERKVSVIICTYMRGEKLIDALWSVLRQSISKKDYEILIVDNAPFKSGVRDQIEAFSEKYSEYGDFIRYVAVPQQGLSYARNTGMWNAVGEYLLFLDDDVLADYYLLEELVSGFRYHGEVGVIGGQVILDAPFPKPDVLRRGWETLWSQFKVNDSQFREVTQQFEFPYGANFSARRSAIWRAGGFRMCYGRVGNDFAGGEETALSFKMLQIGYKIGLQPRAKVLHRVDSDRFTKEHVKKTIRAGVLTSYRFFQDLHTPVGWTKKYVTNQIKICKNEIKKLKRTNADALDVYFKECYLAAWEEMLRNV